MQMLSDAFAAPANAQNPNVQAIGGGLDSIAGVFGNMGQYQMRQLALAQAARAAAAAHQLGGIATGSGAPDPASIAAYFANGGLGPALGEAVRASHSLTGGVDDPMAQQGAAAAGQFPGSPLSQQRAEANTLATQKAAAQIAADAAVRAAGLQDVQGIGPDGQPTFTNRAAIANGNPGHVTPALTVDQGKAAALRPGATPLTGDARVIAGLVDPQKFQVIGKDIFGNDMHGYPPAPPEPGAAPTAPPVSPLESPALKGLTGEPYLQTLEKTGGAAGQFVAGQARAIIAGHIPYPTANAATKPVDIAIMKAVQEANPNFEAGVAPARAAAQKEIADGTQPNSPATLKLALNTALGHAGEMSDLSQQLPGQSDSTSMFVPNHLVNAVKNLTAHGPNAAPLAAYNEAATHAVEELTKFYTGAGGTEAEREAGVKMVNPDASPSERNAAIHELVTLLQTKATELQRRFGTVMGDGATNPIIGPEAQAAIDRINSRAPKAAVQPAATAPQPVQSAPHAAAGPHPRGPAMAAPVAPASPQSATPPTPHTVQSTAQSLQNARAAIAAGKPRDAVVQRLQQQGIDPTGL